MRKHFTLSQVTLAALTLAAAGAAQATNGYFSHGYGIKAKGMGGASVAMAQDAFAGANNPAAAAFAGNRWELGADVFMPKRSMERTGSSVGWDASVESNRNAFLVPEFGYNVALSNKLGVGLTVYGNGGMNTSYPGGQIDCSFLGASATSNVLCGDGKLGVDLIQLIVAPTIAYKLNDNHSIGVSPLLVYQRFKSYGVQFFGALSQFPGDVSNRDGDSSTGFGVRLGYYGKLNDSMSVGASYSPKINMSRFKKYQGLFAEGGDFDIPENFTVGFALKPSSNVSVALDYQRINYSGVASVANPSTNIFTSQLGSANGPGFGWRDINVIKLGVQWDVNPTWTLRAGYNKGDNPVQSRDVTFNILAPGVVKDHLTLGATMNLDKQSELSFSFMYARNNNVSGDSLLNPLVEGFTSGGIVGAGGTESVQMKQTAFGIQYSRKF